MMKMEKSRVLIRISVVVFLLFSIFLYPIFAEDMGGNIDTHIKLPTKPRKIPIEITGDKLEIEPNDTYIVTGNVMVKQGKTEIYCDKGTYNERTGLAKSR